MDGKLALLSLSILIIILAIMMQFIGKMSKLKHAHHESKQLLPLCQTLSAVLDSVSASEREEVLRTMQNSYFRSIWLTVYSKSGEVWADSFQPTYGQLPMPPSDGQQKTYQLIKSNLGGEKQIKTTQFGKCATTRKQESISVAAVELDDFIVCLQTCGCEGE